MCRGKVISNIKNTINKRGSNEEEHEYFSDNEYGRLTNNHAMPDREKDAFYLPIVHVLSGSSDIISFCIYD